jgi:hypothetical protein
MVTLGVAYHTFIFKYVLSSICHITVSGSLSSFFITHIFSRFTKGRTVSHSLLVRILLSSALLVPHTFTYQLKLSCLCNSTQIHSLLQYYLAHEYKRLYNIYLIFTWTFPSLKSTQHSTGQIKPALIYD